MGATTSISTLALLYFSGTALGMSVVNMAAQPESYKLSFSPYVESFSAFKHDHGRRYRNEGEESFRYNQFIRNVKQMEEHNLKYFHGESTFFMDVNHFSDMTHDEYLMYNKLGKYAKYNKSNKNNLTSCSTYTSGKAVPDSIDWRTKGAVTPVKDQGECGSCYIFSATGSIEGQHFLNTGSLLSFSEQQVLDCCTGFFCSGCNGGVMDEVFVYTNRTGGLELESDYSYKAVAGPCQFSKSKVKVDVVGCSNLRAGYEGDLQNAVGNVGPISVGMDASLPSFMSYAGGIYNDPACTYYKLDHGVLAVGYGTLNGSDYWLVKNSWTTKWGIKGYFLLARNNNNQCGIATNPSFPLTAKPSGAVTAECSHHH